MKSGLKVNETTLSSFLSICSNLCRDEKRTERICSGPPAVFTLSSNLCRDEKRTERKNDKIAIIGITNVATYAAMKSGLKAPVGFPSVFDALSSNLCRDEKRTERIRFKARLLLYLGSNLCRDEKRTESTNIIR